MSDPSVLIEPPSNNWRSDNNHNNDNYRQKQTSLSGLRSRRDPSREKHRYKKRRRRRSVSTSFSSTYLSSDSRKRKSRRSKHSCKKRRRSYTSPSSSSSVSHSQVREYGRYQRNRYSPQAVQNPQVLQPEEVSNIQTMTPEQVIPRPSRDLGSDNKMQTWSFDREINEVFRLLPPELCPRQTEEHTPAKPLSGIEQLMESQSTPLMILPQSKLIGNTARFLQDQIDSEKRGKDWVCPQNVVSYLTQTKYS